MVAGIYLILTIPWMFWPHSRLVPGLIAFALYSLLAFSLAVDMTEALLAICWSPKMLRILAGTPNRRDCAILMTICDDLRIESINALLPLTDAGYDIFLLDDSTYPASIPYPAIEHIYHIRRPTNQGAKAGNLNYWISKYSHTYQYIAILDSDSIMSVNAIDILLLAAEYPENEDVAIIQAKIEAAPNPHSLFARIQAVGTKPRARVFERVHGRLGCLVSFGHNQVIRLSALKDVGGFDETLTCEDTVLSLKLASKQWRTEVADVWTYDCDPETVFAYIRRTLRWAQQTVELFHRPWFDVPIRLKLLICRHLLNYCLPVVGIVLLCLSLWLGPFSAQSAWSFFISSIFFVDRYEVYGLAIWSNLTIVVAYLILQTIIAILEGVSFRSLLVSWALGSAPYLFMLIPLIISLVGSAMGYRTRFVPTNSKYALAQDARFNHQILLIFAACILVVFLGIAVIRRPGSLLVGFNAIWLAYLFTSPIAFSILVIAEDRKFSRK